MDLTRRDILRAFLAAPVATSACRRAPPPPVAGSLLGPSMERGHRLRSLSGAALPNPTTTLRVGVAIVGGGPSGLSAAWRLERLGIRDYRVFDLEPRPGGTSSFGTNAVVPYPWGAHYVPLPSAENRALVALLGEMGALAGSDARGQPIGAEEHLVRAPEERIYHLGRWYEGLYLRAGASAEDLRQLSAFEAEVQRFVRLRDARGRRPFAIPVARSSDDAEFLALDRIAMSDWLRDHGFTSRRLLWLVDYACRDDYGLLATDTSAWAGLFYFASRTFESGDTAAELLSWPNGNGHIVEHLARVAGANVETGALVIDVLPRENSVELIVLRGGDTGVRVIADDVVYAAPKMTARHVIRPWRDAAPESVRSLNYGAWMVANVFLKGRPRSRGFPLAWDNVLYDSPSLGYVVATHQALIDHGPTVFTYYYPFTEANGADGRTRMLSLDHAAWCDVILGDLGRAHVGFRDLVDRIDVWRWGHAMARPRIGSMSASARSARAAPLGRIRFAHSDVSGMGLFEEAQHWGVAAAEDIALRRGVVPFERLA
jgi:protoporphyrinogen oxidase